MWVVDGLDVGERTIDERLASRKQRDLILIEIQVVGRSRRSPRPSRNAGAWRTRNPRETTALVYGSPIPGRRAWNARSRRTRRGELVPRATDAPSLDEAIAALVTMAS